MTAYNPQKHHRRSIRLKGYDYTQAGAYFVTVVTWQRDCLFGEVVQGKIDLSEAGKIVREEWFKTGEIRRNVELDEDEFIIMPNHVHGIILLTDDDGRGGSGIRLAESPGQNMMCTGKASMAEQTRPYER